MVILDQVELSETLLCPVKQELVALDRDYQKVLLHDLIVKHCSELFKPEIEEKNFDATFRCKIEICA